MASIPQWVPFVVLLVIIVVPHLLTVAVQLDIWPYSHYPMYSQKKALDAAGWFHVMLEKPDGTRRRWSPSHIRFSREVNRAFSRLARVKQRREQDPRDVESLMDIIERRVREDHRNIDDLEVFSYISIVFVSCPKFRSGDLGLQERVYFRRSLHREDSRQLQARRSAAYI